MPAANPPKKSALRAVGLRISWPISASEVNLRPGTRLVVRVSRVRGARTRRPKARIKLVRVDARGRAIKAVARRAMRAGTFVVRLPSRAGARYALRLAVGKQRYWSWIATSEPAAPVLEPILPLSACPRPGPSAGHARVDPPTGRSWDRLTVSLTNTGSSCLTGGVGYGWERQLAGGRWEEVRPDPYPAPALPFGAAPGQTSTHGAFVWPELDPGPHRLVKTVEGNDGPLLLSARFEVLP